MNQSDAKNKTWKEVVINYIDSLGDTDKKDEYLDEVIANHYSRKIISENNQSTGKEMEKEVKKASKIKPTAKNKQKLKDIYSTFVAKKWIEENVEFFSFLETKTDFYNIWINRAVLSPEGILPATHVAKLSHSSNSASSFFDFTTTKKDCYLSTSSLREKTIDGAYPDAKYSKIVKFFMLTHNSKLLGHEILNGEIIKCFANNEAEFNLWLKSFGKIMNPRPKGDALIKQIYFPLNNNQYHSLVIINSSSLIHHIFMGLFEKEARKTSNKMSSSINKAKYLTGIYKSLPNLSKLLTTQSQPQNVSVLNGKRGGVIRLFSAQPPTWQSQLKLPINRRSLFDNLYNDNIRIEIDYLRNFLLRFKQLDLSIKDPKRLYHLERWVNSIIDEFLFYVGSIQNIPAGWSVQKNIRLKKAHQYLLDPYRDDEAFQTACQSEDWQKVVRDDFAGWMNRQIRGRDKQFTPKAEHARLWKKLLEQPLREHVEQIEQERKHGAGEVA